jgi:hypothetical protein
VLSEGLSPPPHDADNKTTNATFVSCDRDDMDITTLLTTVLRRNLSL